MAFSKGIWVLVDTVNNRIVTSLDTYQITKYVKMVMFFLENVKNVNQLGYWQVAESSVIINQKIIWQ